MWKQLGLTLYEWQCRVLTALYLVDSPSSAKKIEAEAAGLHERAKARLCSQPLADLTKELTKECKKNEALSTELEDLKVELRRYVHESAQMQAELSRRLRESEEEARFQEQKIEKMTATIDRLQEQIAARDVLLRKEREGIAHLQMDLSCPAGQNKEACRQAGEAVTRHKVPVLCLVKESIAYFTTLPLEEQWGKDWDKVPRKAGPPYLFDSNSDDVPWEIVTVAFSGAFVTPSPRLSVKAINRGDAAWLQKETWAPAQTRPIQAGTSLSEFRALLRLAKGRVFQEVITVMITMHVTRVMGSEMFKFEFADLGGEECAASQVFSGQVLFSEVRAEFTRDLLLACKNVAATRVRLLLQNGHKVPPAWDKASLAEIFDTSNHTELFAVSPVVDPVLCYVEGMWAYFTTQPLEQQWGDDWNDSPYECNAGTPYRFHSLDRSYGVAPWKIKIVGFLGDLITPSQDMSISVENINQGNVAWLRPGASAPYTAKPIPAGTRLSEFRRLVDLANGTVLDASDSDESDDESYKCI